MGNDLLSGIKYVAANVITGEEVSINFHSTGRRLEEGMSGKEEVDEMGRRDRRKGKKIGSWERRGWI